MDDPFTHAVKHIVPWVLSLILLMATLGFLSQWQHCERQAVWRGYATYDEKGTFQWKERVISDGKGETN